MITKGQALLAVVASAVLACVSQVQADQAYGVVVTTTDLEAIFDSGIASFRTVDTGGNGMIGPELEVDGTNWNFWVQHKASPFAADEAKEVRIGIRGVHVFGPHNGPKANPKDKDPNVLDLVWSAKQDISKSKKFTRKAEVTHLTTGKPHRDVYSIESTISHGKDKNGDRYLEGDVDITAEHKGSIETKPCSRILGALGSSPQTGTTVSFVSTGPETGYLRFDIGEIDILDMNGGLSGGVDATYASDPVLNGQMGITDLQLVGLGPEGWFEFGGGTVTIADPAGQFTFEGSFDKYSINDTTASNPLTSFGVMTDEYVTDVGDIEDGPSLFLDDYTDTNIFGIGVDEATWDMIDGNSVGFTTQTDLAELTNGFTQTYLNVPATVFLAGNLPVPEPASVLVLASGLASVIGLGLRRRRR